MIIYVSNLSLNTRDEDLKSIFSKLDEVTSVKIISDTILHRNKIN